MYGWCFLICSWILMDWHLVDMNFEYCFVAWNFNDKCILLITKKRKEMGLILVWCLLWQFFLFFAILVQYCSKLFHYYVSSTVANVKSIQEWNIVKSLFQMFFFLCVFTFLWATKHVDSESCHHFLNGGFNKYKKLQLLIVVPCRYYHKHSLCLNFGTPKKGHLASHLYTCCNTRISSVSWRMRKRLIFQNSHLNLTWRLLNGV